jgi:protein-disulfide isomerase
MALGLYCAQKQGKFDALYKKAFEGQAPTNPQAKDVVLLATAAGLDGAQMETCLASPEAIAKVKADIEEAGRAEVTGTPTLFINGKRLGNLNFFLQTIEHEAQRLGLPAVAPQAP